jgi:putative transposase
MRRNKLALYLHLVWATWDRLPLITPDIERPLFRCIQSEARAQGCDILALNGVSDHVHLLVRLPSTVTIANLLRQVKGASSHFANEILRADGSFKWQGTYGAFTVSRWDLDRVIAYVERQKEHHGANDLCAEWEESVEQEGD